MHLQENTLLQGGEYRIIRFIDSGGFGCTYEAYQKSLDRRIAIKEFFWHEHCLRDTNTGRVTVATENNRNDFEKLRNKFVNEARTIAKLHHPGIVRVSAVFEENGTAYYVMDYIEGCSLGDLVKDGEALSEVEALRYIRQVAEALQYVHSKNRLHLDIKPSNIMLDNEGHVILIDFGVSKQYDQSTGLNPSTLLGKSRGYSSIEQMGGDVKTFAPATDIYSLGATLYTLLVGNRPPEAAYIIKGIPIAPLQARGVSNTTIRAIQAAMRADKEDRPQSVSEFLALLDGKEDSGETLFDNEETDYNNPGKTDYEEPKKPTPKQKSKPQPRKNLTWLWVTLVGIAGILLTMVGTNSYQAHQAKIAREQFVADSIAARQRFVADSITACQQFVADSLAAVKKAEDERKEKERLAQADREAEAARKAEEAKKAAAQQVVASEKTYQVGDYYDRNGIRGVVFEVSDGGRHGKIVSLDETQTCWCTESQYNKNIITGSSDKSDGKYNTDIIMARSDRNEYPAFVWCRNKGSNWYLPSKEEIWEIRCNSKMINITLLEHGATVLPNSCWSSTGIDGRYADLAYIAEGGSLWCMGHKNCLYKPVRAAVAF